jgi:bifunctional non-homologous end joining protein LigD
MQKAMKPGRASEELVMYAFDLLYLNGFDLRKAKLTDRKDALRALVKKSGILLSESFETNGAELFKQACEMGLEGVVSKKRDSPYRSDRTDAWIKMPCRQRETLAIVGYSMKDGRFDGLYLGREEDGAIVYAGKVEHGFSREIVKDLRERFAAMVQKTQAYSRPIKKKDVIWIKPTLLAEVEYRAKTGAGKLRHPSFKGLREDL